MIQLPDRLFKYVGPDRIDVLERLRIRFTQPSDFNDPFDIRPALLPRTAKTLAHLEELAARELYRQHESRLRHLSFDTFKETVRPSLAARSKEWSEGESLVRGIVTRALDLNGVLCLTANGNSLLMWSHYAAAHTGFIIEFDPKHAFFYDQRKPQDGEYGVLHRITYTDKRATIEPGHPAPLAMEVFFTKSPQWAYEEEWRVFVRLRENPDAKCIISEGKEIFLFTLPPSAIKRVIMGFRMADDKRKELISALRKNPAFPHVSLMMAEEDPKLHEVHYRAA